MASFQQQDYLTDQIVFGVQEQKDPGIDVVKQLVQNLSSVEIDLVISDRRLDQNLKVSNLVNALAVAQHPFL